MIVLCVFQCLYFIFSVPLGCDVTISLHPYDGDGDVIKCTWSTQQLQHAILDEVKAFLMHLDGSYFYLSQSVELSYVFV